MTYQVQKIRQRKTARHRSTTLASTPTTLIRLSTRQSTSAVRICIIQRFVNNPTRFCHTAEEAAHLLCMYCADEIYFQYLDPNLPCNSWYTTSRRMCASIPPQDRSSISSIRQLSQCMHACGPRCDTATSVNLEEPSKPLRGGLPVRRRLPALDRPTSGRKAETSHCKDYHEAVPLIILY